MKNKIIGVWIIRIIISLLFFVSAYAKVYHDPSAIPFGKGRVRMVTHLDISIEDVEKVISSLKF